MIRSNTSPVSSRVCQDDGKAKVAGRSRFKRSTHLTLAPAERALDIFKAQALECYVGRSGTPPGVWAVANSSMKSNTPEGTLRSN